MTMPNLQISFHVVINPHSRSPANRFDAYLAAIRSLKRLELVSEAVRQVLETLTKAALPFQQGRVKDVWVEHYGQPPMVRLQGAYD